jgi:NADH-quinone oxidoreductase subunit M
MMPALLLQILLTPLLASVVVFLARNHIGRFAGWVTSGALVYTTSLVMVAAVSVIRGQIIIEEYRVIAPNTQNPDAIRLGLLADGLSVSTLAVVLLLCTALALYSIRYIEHRIEILYVDEDQVGQDRHYVRFFYLLPLFPVGFIGTILSTNLIPLYFFMEVLTVSLFFLMAYFGYRERVRVAFMSLSWGIIGALLFLAASLLVYDQIGSWDISQLGQMEGTPFVTGTIFLFLVGLMMKLAIVPFHVWMPSVHAEHPTCIAGLLAVYANLAIYVLIRVVVLPLGNDFQQFGTPLMLLALVTMVYGSLLTMAQTDIKRLAACSTISQIAYSVLGLGALTSSSVQGGMFFFLSHIMGKTVFFSTAGIVVYATGIRDMRQMGGLARQMPVTAALWIVGCMMLSGFPPFSSFTAEWIMFSGIFEKGVLSGPFGIAIALTGVTAISLTVAYSFNAARQIFFGPLNPVLEAKNLSDPPLLMTVPLAIIAIASIILGIFPQPIMNLLDSVLGDL